MKTIIDDIKNKIELPKENIDKKLLFRVRFFFVIFLVIFGFIVYDVAINIIPLPLASLGVTIGILVGLIIGRIFKIDWYKKNSIVVARIDTVGIFMVFVYICFALSREWIFAHWFHGPLLTTFVFSTVAGVMFGRMWSLRVGIQKVLREQKSL